MANLTPEAIHKYVGTPVQVPVLGTVIVPPPEKVAFYAGIGVLAALGLVEWPIALIITVGHVLADQQHFRLARGVGEALEAV
ncbi:hypothetical protein [Pseudonocardia acidicola]|uniref:Uncharacterized protein n=1 Tax=Pseudonocardia acidicola TaxID=2724939 RepID=A0ABX1SG84_9PSEU|nr:hypothetical protein [Pseudonocardia acidicola]NMH99887.1 hypothetical protein [Pseudonocardia acidicola]